MACRHIQKASTRRLGASFSTEVKRSVNGNVQKNKVQPMRSFDKYQDARLPGSRILYLTGSDEKVPSITMELLQSIIDRLNLFSENSIVEAVGFEPKEPKNFCNGIDVTLPTSKKIELLEKYRETYEAITKSKLATFVAYGGNVTDAGLALFSQSNNTLAAQSTKFRVSALKDHGQLPLGGVASALVRKTSSNVGMARYLGLSGARLNCVDLLEMGIVHNVSGELPLAHMFRLMAASPHPSEDLKYEQPRQISMDLAAEVIATMSVDEPLVLKKVNSRSEFWDPLVMVTPEDSVSPIVHSYPELGGNSWEDKEALEKFAPELIDGSRFPGGLCGRFDDIDQFVNDHFSGKNTAKSSMSKLSNTVSTLEKDVQSMMARMSSDAMSDRASLPGTVYTRRHQLLTMQQKLQGAKSALQTLKTVDHNVIDAWFELTSNASQQAVDSIVRQEISFLEGKGATKVSV